MANCSNCEAPLKPGAKFCSECGAAVATAELRCPACDEPIDSTVRFCPRCGHNLTERVADDDVEEPVSEVVYDPVPEGRNWKAMALPFVVIPIFVLIGLLLTRQNQSIQPPGGAASAGAMAGQDDPGVSMEMMEQVGNRIEELKASLESNPQDTTAMLSLAQMYEIAGRFETAAEYYEQYLKLYPDNPQIEIALANAHFRQGHFDAALKIVKDLLKRNPKYELALYNLGVLYAHTNKTDDAIETWQKLIDLYPDSDMARAAQEGMEQLKQIAAENQG
jgi:cytochrome c-type biogenesis protein CcmH/NrfG